WVRGSEEMLVYTDMAAVPTDQSPLVPWKIALSDVRTGRQEILAEGDDQHEEAYAPLPEIDFPWVVWAEVPRVNDPGHGLDVVSYDIRAKSRRVIVHATTPGEVFVQNGIVYYDADSGSGQRDVFQVA